MTCRLTSIPADTPDEVKYLPSSTNRARRTQSTPWPSVSDVTSSKAFLLEVARRPVRCPVSASSSEPVQTDTTCVAASAAVRSQSSSRAFSRSVRTPSPPGMRRRSSGGQSLSE
jgi:hypothetical protein